MQLYLIRSGTQKALEAKEYSIGIGISLGSKWFSVENVVELISWALPYNRGPLVIYVADTIHAINLEVRNRIPYERALRRARERGVTFLENLQGAVRETFAIENQARILYATWDDITDKAYLSKVEYLHKLYESDTVFKDTITTIVRNWVSKEERKFSEIEIEKMGTYILEELPELMGRVEIKGVACDAFTYPKDDDLTRFVEQLQNGEEFSNIRERILDTKPKVFLEVR